MNRYPVRILMGLSVLIGLFAGPGSAQIMPQDSWCYSHKWGTNGAGDGQFNGPQGVAVTPDNLVVVADTQNDRIQVFELDGTFVRKWGSGGSGDGQFSDPYGVAVGSDGLIFVADGSNDRIQVFEADGTFVRKWGVSGSSDGQFDTPYGVAVTPDGLVYVADRNNSRIQVFEADGTFVRKWGVLGSSDGQLNYPYSVAVSPDGLVYVADRANSRIQMFTTDGTFVHKWGGLNPYAVAVASDGLVFAANANTYCINVYEPDGILLRILGGGGSSDADGQFYMPRGIAFTSDGDLLVVERENHRIQVFKHAYRIGAFFGNIPLVYVARCEQRIGMPYLDMDYVIWDSDSPTVTVTVAAFDGGTNSLNNFVRVGTFVDGTESAVGSNILANTTNRISWNVASDWQADYVNLKMRVMANDGRGVLSAGFITLPADGTNTALTISSSPITPEDMLPVWYWLLATGDSSVSLSTGMVYGVGGAYDGQLLAQGTNTTEMGRAFLFDRIDVREATITEVNRARTGPSGVTNAWTLGIVGHSIGPGDRPKAANEYGFDTGNWGVNAWWVVKD